MKEDYYTNNEFFASANGYHGFRSYFADVFNSREHTAVYVLKGGPGTGKSTMLKRLCAYCESARLEYEIFRCSSDPHSLDGIIIRSGDLSVAVLDGTAPHMRDAEIPGAVDELINLGGAWKVPYLRDKRDEIIFLNSKKSKAYFEAYLCLRKSSIFDTNIKAEISSVFNFEACKAACREVAEQFSNGTKEGRRVRLISSFSKFGYCTSDNFFKDRKNLFCVKGVLGSDRLFMNTLVSVLKDAFIPTVVIPSPLDPDSYEGVIVGDAVITVFEKGELLCDSRSFLLCDALEELEENLRPMTEGRDHYMKLAAAELERASEYHFALEDLYTPCMDFDILDQTYAQLLEKIKNIFQTCG